MNVNGQKLVLGTLSHQNFPQLCFDLVFNGEFELSHNWKNGIVYFLGYKTFVPEEGYPFGSLINFCDSQTFTFMNVNVNVNVKYAFLILCFLDSTLFPSPLMTNSVSPIPTFLPTFNFFLFLIKFFSCILFFYTDISSDEESSEEEEELPVATAENGKFSCYSGIYVSN